MKILFSLRHAGALRNFASTIGELAVRGHQIYLLFMTDSKRGDEGALPEIVREYPSITYKQIREEPPWRWRRTVQDARARLDYLRYLAPEYRHAHALRARAEVRLPERWRAQLTGRAGRMAAPAIVTGLRAIERTIPPSPSVLKRIARQAPDVVLAAPLVDLGSGQAEYLKAARALGIPTGFPVHSWDNLTNKGLIHARPDRVFVWNAAQQREAVRLHGIPESHVVVTGAPVFDQWFERRPSTTREAFCRTVGLRADRAFFLYLCSSQFIAPREEKFVRKWIATLRSAADPAVREAGVVVRLHPRLHPKHAARFTFPEFEGVAVWPKGGANPIDATSKNDYFDSLYHAAAAVGVNTTAQIEAAIVGRPVFSVRVPEYTDTQEGTLHFHYLLNESGGLLRIADTLDEHVSALAALLKNPRAYDQQLQSFVRGFVRPHGLDVAATPLLADGIEALARLPRHAPRRSPASPSLMPTAVRQLFR